MSCIYGAPPPALADLPGDAVQVSPLVPGAAAIEDLPPSSLSGATVLAPPGTVERRYVLARMLTALAPDAPLVAMAPKEKGGARLRKELEAFGCAVIESGRRHHRICETVRPDALTGIDEAIAAGALRFVEALGLWTQPGVFSWDRIDAGSRQLMAVLPPLSGKGADLGCGVGVLAQAVLESPTVTELHLVDIDRRAIAAAERNVPDPRVRLHWADVRRTAPASGLDFVVMNPPFHDTGIEDRDLGQGFIRAAHALLKTGGALWMVANRHLPYEAVLGGLFSRVEPRGDAGGFKVYEARK